MIPPHSFASFPSRRALRDFLRLRTELIEVPSLTLTPFAALAGELELAYSNSCGAASGLD